MIFLAAFFGMEGVIIGFFILLIRLATIKCFGRHYLAPFMPFNKREMKDTFLKEENKGEKYRNPLLTDNIKRGHFR